MRVSSSNAIAGVAVASGTALALSLYLLHKLNKVQESISAATAANNAALFQLTQRIEVALGSSLKAIETSQQQQQQQQQQQAAAAAAAPAVRSGRSNSLSSSGNLARVPSYESSMSTSASENAGYKTADEDPDDMDAEPPVQVSPVRKKETKAYDDAPNANANSSSSGGTEWATHSVMAGRADALYEEQKYQEVADLLSASEQSVEVVWRLCRAHKELAEACKLKGEADKCKKLLYEGLEMVSAALSSHPDHWAVHKWYAISVSMTSGYEGTKATITKSVIVKEHFEKAAELNPLDATARHALGLWFWEVASLSWTMRKLAAAIFASPPTGTYDEALAHFQLAEGIKPGFYLRNRLMIAKCHSQLRDKANAKKWAKAALELPVSNHDDKTAAADAKALLASL